MNRFELVLAETLDKHELNEWVRTHPVVFIQNILNIRNNKWGQLPPALHRYLDELRTYYPKMVQDPLRTTLLTPKTTKLIYITLFNNYALEELPEVLGPNALVDIVHSITYQTYRGKSNDLDIIGAFLDCVGIDDFTELASPDNDLFRLVYDSAIHEVVNARPKWPWRKIAKQILANTNNAGFGAKVTVNGLCNKLRQLAGRR